MKHVTIKPFKGDIVTMTAAKGYALKSKNGKKLHKSVKTPHQEPWRVVTEDGKPVVDEE